MCYAWNIVKNLDLMVLQKYTAITTILLISSYLQIACYIARLHVL